MAEGDRNGIPNNDQQIIFPFMDDPQSSVEHLLPFSLLSSMSLLSPFFSSFSFVLFFSTFFPGLIFPCLFLLLVVLSLFLRFSSLHTRSHLIFIFPFSSLLLRFSSFLFPALFCSSLSSYFSSSLFSTLSSSSLGVTDDHQTRPWNTWLSLNNNNGKNKCR